MRDALGTSPMLRSRRGSMYSRVGGSRFHAAMGEVVEMRARRSIVGCGIEVFGMGGERCCFVRGRTSEVEVRSSGRASERKDKERELSRAGLTARSQLRRSCLLFLHSNTFTSLRDH